MTKGTGINEGMREYDDMEAVISEQLSECTMATVGHNPQLH